MTKLADFELKEILRNDPGHHLLCLHLTTKLQNIAAGDSACSESTDAKKIKTDGTEVQQNGTDASDAVLIVEKTAFDQEAIQAMLSKDTDLALIAENHVYKNCHVTLPHKHNSLKGTLIFPATKAHVEKYSDQKVMMVCETYADYLNITLPHIESIKLSIQWVYNILDHKSEQDSILFEDHDEEIGFILLPDLKWDRKSLDTMYFTAICKKRNIKSLRDLNAEHLPLLKNIRRSTCKAIEEKYSVKAEELRMFLHYQPSYYHLHVHFVHLNAEPIGATAGHAHLLDDVIDNIEMAGDYYQRKALHFTLKQNNPLLAKLTKT